MYCFIIHNELYLYIGIKEERIINMTFPELLNEYICTLNCTAREIAEASGLTSASLSRYKNEQRTPAKDTIKKLSSGIANIAEQKGLTDIDYNTVFEKFSYELGIADEETFSINFTNLINSLQINLNELARNMGYDPSYLSRIKKGQRMPSDISLFAERLSRFLIKKYEINQLCNLTGFICDNNNLTDSDFTESVINYLCSNQETESEDIKNNINDYLKKLDEFDLNEYITIIKFDKLKVPTAPFSFPSSKNYYGIEQMKQGELDFFKATAVSRSREPIFMNSDMPMADMAEDMEFNKKWMFGIAVCLKKGLHLNMIHNVERPIEEMILGLEAWIPIYMTGQITPYYIKNINTSVYHHLNYVSGAAALTGECINGYHNDGKYYLTNSKHELEYYRNKANHILSKAKPLMNIFTEESKNSFYDFFEQESKKCGEYCNLYSSLPLYTISDELFINMLEKNNISKDIQKNLLNDLHIIKSNFIKEIELGSVHDIIPVFSEIEYKKLPLTLFLSDTFYKTEIYYTYEEYYQHYMQTVDFEKKYHNYKVSEQKTQIFKNIQIRIKNNKWIIISKNKSPVIHFIIHHPKMIEAIEKGFPW